MALSNCFQASGMRGSVMLRYANKMLFRSMFEQWAHAMSFAIVYPSFLLVFRGRMWWRPFGDFMPSRRTCCRHHFFNVDVRLECKRLDQISFRCSNNMFKLRVSLLQILSSAVCHRLPWYELGRYTLQVAIHVFPRTDCRQTAKWTFIIIEDGAGIGSKIFTAESSVYSACIAWD